MIQPFEPVPARAHPTPMERALSAAIEAAEKGEVPVGAVITDARRSVIAVTANRVEADLDPTAHAEILALREAAFRLNTSRLIECDLWVTLEPCIMCAGAIAQARIRRLYFGAADPKGGAVDHGPRVFTSASCHHRPEVYGGISEARAGDLLRSFFQARR